ncbi:MAG: nodulation protein NfeD [Gammaproteobacteria bacterium]|nr:nodulation protein NfeD [Gammaproteobacteria bacterium]
MRRILAVLCVALAVGLLHGETRTKAILLSVNDAIGPAITDYLERGLEQAHAAGAEIVIIQLDTPGGLDLAMRSIIQAVIASPVPVAIHVAPAGARAASAGTYMMYAAHVAAMAPGTNLGAATPVQMGGMPGMEPPQRPDAPTPEPSPQPDASAADEDAGNSDDPSAASYDPNAASNDPSATSDAQADADAAPTGQQQAVPGNAEAMRNKIVNDAVAYIRSLAELRGRNAKWAEQAVRAGASLSAGAALEAGVIDIIARDIPDLLQQTDGMTVTVQNTERTLHTDGLIVEAIAPDWRNELLAIITNPNIAYILMLLGIYGLFFELANPGYVLPGVIGGISLLLALYALQVLPVNYAGLGLMLLGVALMVGELFVPSFGILGIGGVISFVLGSVLLFDRDSGHLAVSLPLISAVSILSAGFFLVVLRSLYASRRRPVVAGAEELIGATGIIAADFDDNGIIHIHGEQWNARSKTPLHNGARARVTGRDGLTLLVEPLSPAEDSSP